MNRPLAPHVAAAIRAAAQPKVQPPSVALPRRHAAGAAGGRPENPAMASHVAAAVLQPRGIPSAGREAAAHVRAAVTTLAAPRPSAARSVPGRTDRSTAQPELTAGGKNLGTFSEPLGIMAYDDALAEWKKGNRGPLQELERGLVAASAAKVKYLPEMIGAERIRVMVVRGLHRNTAKGVDYTPETELHQSLQISAQGGLKGQNFHLVYRLTGSGVELSHVDQTNSISEEDAWALLKRAKEWGDSGFELPLQPGTSPPPSPFGGFTSTTTTISSTPHYGFVPPVYTTWQQDARKLWLDPSYPLSNEHKIWDIARQVGRTPYEVVDLLRANGLM